MLKKIKNVFEYIGRNAVLVYNEHSECLEEYADICEATNKIASLSNYDFADAFSATAREICYCRSGKTRDVFCALADECCQMLAQGKDYAEVLYHFDMMLAKEKGR